MKFIVCSPISGFFIIGLMLFLYVVLDGFDLGVGILSLFTRNDKHRAIMMTSLESIWDANETWLVLLGGALFGAFPLVYAIALQSLYIPVMVMLFALIFRGVAFEFSHHARNKAPWNLAFGYSSLLAGLAQGIAFGGLISGLGLTESDHHGNAWAWFTPFSALVALGVVTGYTLLSNLFDHKDRRRNSANKYCSILCSCCSGNSYPDYSSDLGIQVQSTFCSSLG
jgi:cytochrome d ubiquinol oxidase subunit II